MTENKALTITKEAEVLPVKPLGTTISFAPTNFTEALAFANMLAKSGMVPKDFIGKPESILAAMQMGSEIGLAPMQSLNGIAVINGRPCVWGDAMLAVVMGHPAYEWHKEWIEGEGDKRVAHFQIKRKGQEIHESEFSVQDAKTAELWSKDIWKKYPERMLQMRGRAFGCRDKFPDALKGIKTAEEAMDTPPDTIELGPPAPKRARETGALKASKEGNRGHGNEGMQDEQLQKPKETEAKVRSDGAPQETTAPVESATTETAPETVGSGRRPDSQGASTYLKRIENKKTTKGVDYLRCYFDSGDGGEVVVMNYHKSLFAACATAINKPCEILFHQKDDKYSLDDFVSIDGMYYHQGKPTGPVEQPQLGFAEPKGEGA